MNRLITLLLLMPIVATADGLVGEKFVVLTNRDFKAICTKDKTECKCFIYRDGWVEFECPKPKKEQVEKEQ